MKWIKWIWYYLTKPKIDICLSAEYFKIGDVVKNCCGKELFLLSKRKMEYWVVYKAAIL